MDVPLGHLVVVMEGRFVVMTGSVEEALQASGPWTRCRKQFAPSTSLVENRSAAHFCLNLPDTITRILVQAFKIIARLS